jgi:hypothetical protein
MRRTVGSLTWLREPTIRGYRAIVRRRERWGDRMSDRTVLVSE